MPQTTWATVADVASLTGVTVTSTDAANAIVELHAGRTYTVAVTRTGTRDLEMMRRAVAYQSAWMLAQPDLFPRLDYTQIPKETGTPTGITESAMTLAPLARLALRRVSWLKSRSLHVRSPFVDGGGPLSLNDDALPWQAL